MDQSKLDKVLEKAKKAWLSENRPTATLQNVQAVQMDSAFVEVVIKFIEVAENLTMYSGAEKKSFVIENVKNYATKCAQEVNVQQLGQLIEDLIGLTKKVNVK